MSGQRCLQHSNQLRGKGLPELPTGTLQQEKWSPANACFAIQGSATLWLGGFCPTRKYPQVDQPKKSRRATGRVASAEASLAAGVSPITASRALRGEASVRSTRCWFTASATRPPAWATCPTPPRALVSQRSNHVAILISKLSNAPFVDLLDAA